MAAEPRPWHRMWRLLAKRTMSCTVRKYISYWQLGNQGQLLLQPGLHLRGNALRVALGRTGSR